MNWLLGAADFLIAYLPLPCRYIMAKRDDSRRMALSVVHHSLYLRCSWVYTPLVDGCHTMDYPRRVLHPMDSYRSVFRHRLPATIPYRPVQRKTKSLNRKKTTLYHITVNPACTLMPACGKNQT